VSKIFTYGLAAPINGFPLLLFGVGIWLIVANWPKVWAFVWGGLFLFAAWAFGPRLSKMPKDIVQRSEAPHLYAFVDGIAGAVGAPKVRGLIVNSEFNASFQRVGIRRASIVTIGLPFWTVLDAQERVALLGHEFAHGTNGDNLSQGFIGQAVRTLLRLAYILQPDTSDFFTVLISPLLAVISGAFERLAYLLIILSWQRSQEAEFLADYASARTGGTEAAVSLLHKPSLGAYVVPVLETITYRPDWQKQNFFSEFKKFIADLPPLELERSKRLLDRGEFEKGTTHPPGWARIRFLEEHPSAPSYVPDPAEVAAVDQELAKFETRLTGKLLATYYPDH
jgi:Zn-dependent protease with chaperone function